MAYQHDTSSSPRRRRRRRRRRGRRGRGSTRKRCHQLRRPRSGPVQQERLHGSLKSSPTKNAFVYVHDDCKLLSHQEMCEAKDSIHRGNDTLLSPGQHGCPATTNSDHQGYLRVVCVVPSDLSTREQFLAATQCYVPFYLVGGWRSCIITGVTSVLNLQAIKKVSVLTPVDVGAENLVRRLRAAPTQEEEHRIIVEEQMKFEPVASGPIPGGAALRTQAMEQHDLDYTFGATHPSSALEEQANVFSDENDDLLTGRQMYQAFTTLLGETRDPLMLPGEKGVPSVTQTGPKKFLQAVCHLTSDVYSFLLQRSMRFHHTYPVLGASASSLMW